MKVSSSTTNYQKKPAFGTLYHSLMFPTIKSYNALELKDYAKSAQTLDSVSDKSKFDVYIEPLKPSDPRYSNGDILVSYEPKNRKIKYCPPQFFYSFSEFKSNFPQIMQDMETNIKRAATRITSIASCRSYTKDFPIEGGKNV